MRIQHPGSPFFAKTNCRRYHKTLNLATNDFLKYFDKINYQRELWLVFSEGEKFFGEKGRLKRRKAGKGDERNV